MMRTLFLLIGVADFMRWLRSMCLKFKSCLSIIYTIVVYTNSGLLLESGEEMGTGMELIIFLVSAVKSSGLSNRLVKESIPLSLIPCFPA